MGRSVVLVSYRKDSGHRNVALELSDGSDIGNANETVVFQNIQSFQTQSRVFRIFNRFLFKVLYFDWNFNKIGS